MHIFEMHAERESLQFVRHDRIACIKDPSMIHVCSQELSHSSARFLGWSTSKTNFIMWGWIHKSISNILLLFHLLRLCLFSGFQGMWWSFFQWDIYPIYYLVEEMESSLFLLFGFRNTKGWMDDPFVSVKWPSRWARVSYSFPFLPSSSLSGT